MNIVLILTVTMIVPQLAQGQATQLTNDAFNTSGLSNLMFVSSVEEAKELAQRDIENSTPFLVLLGGLDATVYTTDSLFETQFQITYYDHGCIGPALEIIEAYNQVTWLDPLLIRISLQG
jgi:hypothetical protein